jgi:hypothetical protein
MKELKMLSKNGFQNVPNTFTRTSRIVQLHRGTGLGGNVA